VVKVLTEHRGGQLVAKIERKQGRDGANGLLSTFKTSGIKPGMAYRWQLIATVPVAHIRKLEAKHNDAARALPANAILKLAKSLARDERVLTPRAPVPALTERYRLITSPAAALVDVLEAESVDCILTDPPYEREYLSTYDDLAHLAAHVLRPGGSCIVMTGGAHLPAVIASLAATLTYQWTLAFLTPGESTQVFGRHVKSSWKPVLWFVKGKYTGEHVNDVVRSESAAGAKDFHAWGQVESGFAQLVENFSYKGQTILDPFVGGGTTAVVGVRLERVVIGSDIDAAHVDSTARRLQALVEA
jgi:site-specific DNA-methyltransferase (adenine-specific)